MLAETKESSEKLITILLDLGLNNYEAKVYLTLITQGPSTAKEISDIANIHYGKVYEIIGILNQKGFCITLPVRPVKCQAVSPEKVVKKLKGFHCEKIKLLADQIHQNLTPLYQKSKNFLEPQGSFSLIKGRTETLEKIKNLIDQAQHHIYVCTTENGLKRLTLHKRELQEAKKRKVQIKISSCISQDNHEDYLSLKFCNLKNFPEAYTNFVSIDKKESLISEAIPDDDSIINGQDQGIHIQNEHFTALFEDCFVEHFKKTGGKHRDKSRNN